MKENQISPEQMEAMKDIITKELGVDFSQLFEEYSNDPSYLEYREGKELTEDDLIADIMEDGEMTLGSDASFEEIVANGALTIAISLGLL
jgi:hypothetical protein